MGTRSGSRNAANSTQTGDIRVFDCDADGEQCVQRGVAAALSQAKGVALDTFGNIAAVNDSRILYAPRCITGDPLCPVSGYGSTHGPLVVPGLIATAVLSFIFAWNEFLYAFMLGGRTVKTLPVAIPTLITAQGVKWGELAIVGQVGDSRVYMARGDDVRQLTEDHTLLNMQVKQGLASADKARGRKSQITRAIGLREFVEVDIMAFPLQLGDRLLLCSDGLHEYLDQAADTLIDLFRLHPRVAAPAAIRYANLCGGKDNITALFVEIVEGGRER